MTSLESGVDPSDVETEAGSGDKVRLRYRLLTGPDDSSFCQRVSDALDDGYILAGSPAITSTGSGVVVAQAVMLLD